MQDRINYLFERLNGFIIQEECGGIPSLFAEGSECEKPYGMAYNARERISKALGNGNDGENKDALLIVECHEKITKLLCAAMYRYGYLDAKKDLIKENEVAKNGKY